jgi:NAD(P)H-dependent FMN reductase
MNIAIISSSVRTGRKSHWLALYFKKYIEDNKLATVKILDLMEYQFPIFEERLKFLPFAPANLVAFADEIVKADGVIIVTPEYNGGYPASLKNAIDSIHAEWKRKPVGLVTVSTGMFGGAQVTTSLLLTLWKIGAWMIPASFPVPKVNEYFTENGDAVDKETTDQRAKNFIGELLWCMEAGKKMK